MQVKTPKSIIIKSLIPLALVVAVILIFIYLAYKQ